MEPREKFIKALERKPIKGRVPHFELVFFSQWKHSGKSILLIEIIHSGTR
jgi:hypothetical protein